MRLGERHPMNTADTVTTWTFSARSDLVVTGHDPEDGEAFHGCRWYVVATSSRGARYAHDYSETVRRDEMPESIALLLARMETANISPVGRAHWHPIDPEYGSPAYRAEEPEIVAMEKRDALDWEADNRGCAFAR